MYYRILLPAALVLCLIHGCAHTSRKGKDVPGVQSPDAVAVCMETGSGIPKEAMAVIRAYPDQGLTYRDNKLVFADGTSIVFDDGVEKDFATKLDRSDVEDMFSFAYDRDGQPDYLADAGRSRCEPLFKKMYGKSAKQVRKNLVHVAWFGQTVPFTRVNGANRQLEKVASGQRVHFDFSSSGVIFVTDHRADQHGDSMGTTLLGARIRTDLRPLLDGGEKVVLDFPALTP